MLGTACTTIRVCNGAPEFWRLHKERLQYFAIVLNRQFNLATIETEVLRHAAKVERGAVEIDRQGKCKSIPTSPTMKDFVGIQYRAIDNGGSRN